MIEVFCDGGSRGNPGYAAFGYLVKVNSRVIHQGLGFIGIATNNVAEYTAVIEGLKWLQKDYGKKDINFYLDSKLVVSQLSGIFKVKNPNIRNLVLEIRALETKFGQIRYHHIPRSQNSWADALVNRALDEHIASSN